MGTCDCGTEDIKIYACSGSSDLGALADLATRRVAAAGAASMGCLAALGANRSAKIKDAKDAQVIAVDGCPLDCAKAIMDNAGIPLKAHLRLTDLGLKKGQTGGDDAVTTLVSKALFDVVTA